jgi:hypothetical protein
MHPNSKIKIDRTGMTYGRLKVIGLGNKRRPNRIYWLCQCECGKKLQVLSQNLNNGSTQSCGCYSRDILIKRQTTHGMTKTPEFESWRSMLYRCNNKNYRQYKHYGGRGIRVCKRWNSFSNFYADMGARPAGTTLDRINTNRGYSKSNCRWATLKEQNRNSRSNVWIKYKGKKILVVELAKDKLGIKHNYHRKLMTLLKSSNDIHY